MQGSSKSANNQLISSPENKTLFHKSCIVVYSKQKLSRKRKQKLKENDNGDKTGSCNVNLEDEKEGKKIKKKSQEFRNTLGMCFLSVRKKFIKILDRKIVINV